MLCTFATHEAAAALTFDRLSHATCTLIAFFGLHGQAAALIQVSAIEDQQVLSGTPHSTPSGP